MRETAAARGTGTVAVADIEESAPAERPVRGRRMRITFVIGPYFPVPFFGGVETFQPALAELLAARGHEVTMISRRYPDLPDEEVRNGVRHIRVKSRTAPRSRLGFRLYDLVYSRRVAATLPESDITITNSFFLPIILPRRRAGRIYVHVARYPKGQMWLYWRADRLQAVSSIVADAIRRQTPILADRIVVIPPPLSDLRQTLVAPEKLSGRSPTIVFVGRIAREKGIHHLIEAFAALSRGPLAGYRLRIVGPHETRRFGDGEEYLAELKRLAAPAGDAVVFDGFVAVETLRNILETADIFVYPSVAEWGESFGMAPVEAMAAGCRVLVSDLPCFYEFLEPGRNGCVFDHRREPVRALAAALVDMVSRADAASMREAARATAERYQLASIADRFLEDFARLMHEPAAA
jgi:glycosyltransferase involved in cell wall biosynthesis